MYAGQNLESNQSGRSALYIEETDIFVLSKMYSEDKFQKFQKGGTIDSVRVVMA